MKSICNKVATVLILSVFWALGSATEPAMAQAWNPTTNSSLSISMQRGVAALTIQRADLQQGAPANCTVTSVTINTAPHHGQLIEKSTEVIYVPDFDFWTLGSDQVIFTRKLGGSCFGTTETFMLNLLAAKFVSSPTFSEEFETASGDYTEVEGAGSSLERTETAALAGAWGLSIESELGADAYLGFISLLSHGGDQGGELRMKINLPPSPFAGEELDMLAYQLVRADHGQPYLRIRLHQTSTTSRLRAETLSDHQYLWNLSPWTEVSTDTHDITLDFWRGDSQRQAGVGFWVDGVLESRLPWTPPTDSHVSLQHRFGVMDALSDSAIGTTMDTLCFIGGYQSDAFQILAADGFEEELITDLPSPSPISAHANAAITGQGGLEVPVSASTANGHYLVDDSPTAEENFGVRFDVDTSLLTLPNWQGITLAGGSHTEAPTLGNEAFKIRLRATPSGFQVRAVARLEDAPSQQGHVVTAWTAIDAGVHNLSVQWHAGEDGSTQGRVRLWVDGALAGEVINIDNSQWRVESFWLGARKADPGATGTLYYDNFQTWRPM